MTSVQQAKVLNTIMYEVLVGTYNTPEREAANPLTNVPCRVDQYYPATLSQELPPSEYSICRLRLEMHIQTVVCIVPYLVLPSPETLR
jgi:hypothetical protein